jgi:hypothetical protein
MPDQMTSTHQPLAPSPDSTDGGTPAPAASGDGAEPGTLAEPTVAEAAGEAASEAPTGADAGPAGARGRDDGDLDLGRIAWVLTVLGCLVAVVILVLEGYFGYAGVTFAVGAAAAINLT